MKKIIASLLLLLAGQASAAITLDKPDMVGTWIAPESQDFISSISRLFKDQPRDSLEIRRDLSVQLTRRFSDGKEQVLSAPPSMVMGCSTASRLRLSRPLAANNSFKPKPLRGSA